MKKIGLVGGTGPESTLMYYRELNRRVEKMTNGEAMPDLVIESVNFPRAWKLVTDGDYEALANYLSEKVKCLQGAGAEVISLTAGTMHIVYDEIVEKTGADLVSIPKAVCEEVMERGYKSVGLLGTIFTMEQDYMKKDFREAGIQICVPDKADRDRVAELIYNELERGIVKESTLQEFQQIINKMQEQYGIETVILGCTELPLLLNEGNCPIPCLDSVEIHIEKLIRLIQGERSMNGVHNIYEVGE